MIALGYLAGMYPVRPWRSRRTRAAVRIGSDNAYGIYLAQMIFITSLGALGWNTFVVEAPFYVWLPLTVAIAYFGGVLLTALLARTPLAVPLTGRAVCALILPSMPRFRAGYMLSRCFGRGRDLGRAS